MYPRALVLGSGVSDAYSVPLIESAPEQVRFYKPCTSAASESEFDHADRILCLNGGVLVYKGSRLSTCQGYLSVAHLFYGRLQLIVCSGNRTHDLLSLDTQDVERGQFRCARTAHETPCAYLFEG